MIIRCHIYFPFSHCGDCVLHPLVGATVLESLCAYSTFVSMMVELLTSNTVASISDCAALKSINVFPLFTITLVRNILS